MSKPFEGLTLAGLATDRCHLVEGSTVRLYFRLSNTAPIGWSYLFATVWQAVVYPDKARTGVEGDAIWVECVPDLLAAHHLPELENAVALTNEMYLEKTHQQALGMLRDTAVQAQLEAQLQELNQQLYPDAHGSADRGAAPTSVLRKLIAGLKGLLCPPPRHLR